MPDTPPPLTVWAEDADPSRPTPRTLPPRHAERMAADVLNRLAGASAPPRRKPAWWGWGLGVLLLAAGGAVAWWRLDEPLLHIPSAVLLVGGFAVLVKTLMGYR